ncbi:MULTISPECIES: hypothetical protein [unclassified Bradyrhizobium]|uniref:hypothetical protein n=1 Tax=unclassified Bradyrhizobium TaxID=2631580 RepID=UPI001FFA562A|nr:MULTISPECIES: hypothetical protein [unclassified Bradyrhizobium]MCK1289714.1 hypothetical protein [Bradyrhizobium sp. 30]MCK1304752.1 hypothetical protein [Bradyrhizobium sp. 45]MCK1314136.1 hypothetical protein [Bradyrhizobium sp. 23]MCK1508636.1 hypothetical protein [Bradyrhizobium sp. 18]MCK1608144.1 hypothetical protein [Bradyrhizobium sp. 163]
MTEIVDTASAAATEALKPGPEAVAATTNEQVYMPEATDAATTPAPLFTRKKRGPAPMRANKRVAAARAKKTASRPKKTAKQDAKAPKKAAKTAAPKKSTKRASTKTAKKLAPKKPPKKGKKSKR